MVGQLSECAVLEKQVTEHPLLKKINELMIETTNAEFGILHPHKDGWNRFSFGKKHGFQDFCKCVQTSKDGAKNCKMCHVLMSVAACSLGKNEQVCHAGARVLVAPVPCRKSDVLAILSSCMMSTSGEDPEKVWKEVEKRGKALGLNEKELRAKFNKLSNLSEKQAKLACSLMDIAAEAICEIRARVTLQHDLTEVRTARGRKNVVQTTVKEQLQNRGRIEKDAAPHEGGKGRAHKHALVRVLEDMVSQRPDLPYSVVDIAAAARITPNHFSMLFRNYKGQSFLEFVTQVRIKKAKELLGDLTLNINEVAARVGYTDPGYFTRRFRQVMGMSPRKWREQLSH